MKKSEILQKLRGELVAAEYRLEKSLYNGYSGYDQEVAEHLGITLPQLEDPIYDNNEALSDVRHLAKMIMHYEG